MHIFSKNVVVVAYIFTSDLKHERRKKTVRELEQSTKV